MLASKKKGSDGTRAHASTAVAEARELPYATGPAAPRLGNRAMRGLLGADSHSDTVSSSGATITLSGRGMTHPVAVAMRRPGVRFRVPSFDKLKSTYTDKDLKIPEAVVKARVTQLLERM